MDTMSHAEFLEAYGSLNLFLANFPIGDTTPIYDQLGAHLLDATRVRADLWIVTE